MHRTFESPANSRISSIDSEGTIRRIEHELELPRPRSKVPTPQRVDLAPRCRVRQANECAVLRFKRLPTGHRAKYFAQIAPQHADVEILVGSCLALQEEVDRPPARNPPWHR